MQASGKLAPTDFVWTAELGEWKAASTVFKFSAQLSPPPPPAPQPRVSSAPTTVHQTTVVEGGSFKFGTLVWIVIGLIVPLWPISLPVCWYLAYRSYKKPISQTVRVTTG
jgi:hypothetical protein